MQIPLVTRNQVTSGVAPKLRVVRFLNGAAHSIFHFSLPLPTDPKFNHAASMYNSFVGVNSRLSADVSYRGYRAACVQLTYPPQPLDERLRGLPNTQVASIEELFTAIGYDAATGKYVD